MHAWYHITWGIRETINYLTRVSHASTLIASNVFVQIEVSDVEQFYLQYLLLTSLYRFASMYEYLNSICIWMCRDIKSANILLSEDGYCKVADFGLCKEAPGSWRGSDDLILTATAIRGSFGYLDPEYVCTSVLSDKSDVYSYGVVLLELISGQKSIHECQPLAYWVSIPRVFNFGIWSDFLLYRCRARAPIALWSILWSILLSILWWINNNDTSWHVSAGRGIFMWRGKDAFVGRPSTERRLRYRGSSSSMWHRSSVCRGNGMYSPPTALVNVLLSFVNKHRHD